MITCDMEYATMFNALALELIRYLSWCRNLYLQKALTCLNGTNNQPLKEGIWFWRSILYSTDGSFIVSDFEASLRS